MFQSQFPSVSEICEISTQIRDCDSSYFLSKCRQWYEKLIIPIEKLASSKNSEIIESTSITARASVLTLCRLLPAATEFHEIARELSASKIHALVKLLIQCPSWFDQWALLGVNICMKYFPDASKRDFANIILPFVDRCLQNSDDIVRRRIANCIALFPMIAGNTRRSGAWNQQFEKTLLYLHASFVRTLDPLVSHDDQCQFSSELDKAENLLDGGDVLKYFIQLFPADSETMAHRPRILLDVLRAMLTDYDNLTISINVQHFVDLLCCLIAYMEKLRNPKKEVNDFVIELTLIIGELVIPAIGIIAAPFTSNFVDAALRLLRQRNLTEGMNRVEEFGLIGSVFVLLAAIAKHVGPAALSAFQRMTSKSLDFTEQLLQRDLVQPKSIDAATSVEANGPKRKAQKRKALLMEELSNDRLVTKMKNSTFNQRSDAIKNCFQLWTCVLESGGGFMKANDFRRLQQLVCRLLPQIQNGQRALHYYSFKNADCRSSLYDVLIALVSCPHPSRPSALQCAVRIFEIGQRRDNDPKVRNVCSNGLLLCNALAKPRLPYLDNILVEEETESDDRMEERDRRMVNREIMEKPLETAASKPPIVQEPIPTAVASSEERMESLPRITVEEPSATSAETASTAPKPPVITDIEEQRDGKAEEMVTIEDDDESNVVPCIQQKPNAAENQDVIQSSHEDTISDDQNNQVTSMLEDFVEMPADEVINVYID